MPHDYYEEAQELRQENGRLKQALRDIAQSEEIPTSRKAYEFCRDVAREALKSELE